MGTNNAAANNDSQSNDNGSNTAAITAARRKKQIDATDAKFKYDRYQYSNDPNALQTRRGWIFNMAATTLRDEASGQDFSGLDVYMVQQTGETFKCTVIHNPYFYVVPREGSNLNELAGLITRQCSSVRRVKVVEKEDMDLVNHLSGKRRSLLKLVFHNEDDLQQCKAELRPLILSNKASADDKNMADLMRRVNSNCNSNGTSISQRTDPMQNLIDMREYDVPYVVRTCIDLEIRAGCWYTATPVTLVSSNTTTTSTATTKPYNNNEQNKEEKDGKDDEKDRILGSAELSDQDFTKIKAEPSYLAFDIECTKAPLKFPNADIDEIYMISYMVNGQGYLINSRTVVSQDVPNFEYTPKPNFPGPFKIFNEPNEQQLIRRFFDEFQKHRPQIVITYNGDFFDWPFLETRASQYGLDIATEMGVEQVGEEYRGRCCVHLDAFAWVKRDSYLPQGAQGLKAVTKYKLGYDPVEVDPEDMVRFAKERPVHMASYSVSDAVATYYLYEKYVHLFIFSLCTLIPMGPEDVLRKGSGTLCESLLMVDACWKNIICPNKQIEPTEQFFKGHLLESQTYLGGHVECLEAGVFRSDVQYDFHLNSDALEGLISNVDRDLEFAIEVEAGKDRFDVTNYDEVGVYHAVLYFCECHIHGCVFL